MRHFISLVENTVANTDGPTPQEQSLIDNIERNRLSVAFSVLSSWQTPSTYISKALSTAKKSVLEYLDAAIDDEKWIMTCNCLLGLKNLGIDWPELPKIVTDMKTSCIKYMLTVLKNSYDEEDELEYIIKVARYLMRYTTQWTELPIIINAAEDAFEKILDNYPQNNDDDDGPDELDDIYYRGN